MSIVIAIIVIVALSFGLFWLVSKLGGFNFEQGKQIYEEATKETGSTDPEVLYEYVKTHYTDIATQHNFLLYMDYLYPFSPM